MHKNDLPGTWRFDTALSDESEGFVTDNLIAFNRAHGPTCPAVRRPAEAVQVFARDGSGAIVGGVVGRTHALPDWLEVSIVWVDESARGRGLGRELMAQAEAEASRRGCRFARLATSNFQAPGFYEKLGYTQYGQLADCPPGETVFYFRKDLASVPDAEVSDEAGEDVG